MNHLLNFCHTQRSTMSTNKDKFWMESNAVQIWTSSSVRFLKAPCWASPNF